MVERLAHTMIEKGVLLGVSDVHILPLETGYGVYFRTQGYLEPCDSLSDEQGKRLISYFKFAANMDVGEKRHPQSGASEMQLAEEVVELRFSTMTNVRLKESLVIRILRQQQSNLAELGSYYPSDIPVLERLIQRKSGLVLFSGPVGSGKTTTIYQLLRTRSHKETLQVITMEDPVELYDERFLQTEVNEASGITYDVLIKASLRHHPDILLIGEIRDEETARMAIRGALTGHLMIATIHAKDALGVMARLEELQISPEQMKQTLIGVISQRLLPRYCNLCQGRCHRYCQHIPSERKRSALLEILSGPALQKYFDTGEADYLRLNQRLKKVWAYGYIDTETYLHFELV